MLKYNQLEPPAHPQGVTQIKFKEKIEELSKGQIKVQNYASGTLFTQVGEVTAMMNGDLELSTLVFQDMALRSHIGDVRGPVCVRQLRAHGEGLREELEGSGRLLRDDFRQQPRPLAAMTQGSRVLNLKKMDLAKTPADLKGVNLRMPNAPSWIDVGKSLGANVTPGRVYAETYTALQTGAVDAQDNPSPGHLRHEVLRGGQADLPDQAHHRREAAVRHRLERDDGAAEAVDDRGGAVRLRAGQRGDVQAGGRAAGQDGGTRGQVHRARRQGLPEELLRVLQGQQPHEGLGHGPVQPCPGAGEVASRRDISRGQALPGQRLFVTRRRRVAGGYGR
ncbi:MAG: TRAP transporter substrate-binding protein DctP [Marinilabiliales bacterium]|nr:TRAP transporter substrate-binding protein DctP [Marinilabiliales bacterium]